MKTCENCIYCIACQAAYTHLEGTCSLFKDKDQFVKLLCKIGNKIYLIEQDNTISKCYVAGFRKCFNKSFCCEVGKTVFLTKAEAEQALKESEKNAENNNMGQQK